MIQKLNAKHTILKVDALPRVVVGVLPRLHALQQLPRLPVHKMLIKLTVSGIVQVTHAEIRFAVIMQDQLTVHVKV